MAVRALEVLVVVLAAVAAVMPWSPASVETWFSTGWYPRVQHALTPLSNVVPFALFDLVVVGSVVAAVWAIWRAIRLARRQRRVRPVLVCVGHLVAAVAFGYLLFLGTWGLNYRRVAMTERLASEPGRPDRDRVVQLGMEAAAHMNALYDEAHASGWREAPWDNARLRAAFDETQRRLSNARPAVPGRLKTTIFGPYFRWTGVDGMVDPFALEVLANPDLLPWERPFVAAHEWAHLAGYADESEANFVGWQTCLRADAGARYSGWMYIYWQVSGEVAGADRASLAATLGAGPRRDIELVVDRLRRGQLPSLRAASWLVYDQYLKANRVDEGVRSYGAVITLILQSKFEADWVPIRRDRVPAS